jgi:hypothetical protein
MKRFGYVASAALVALSMALSPAALAAGHGGGGFGGHVGGFGGHVAGFGGNFGGFGSHVDGFGGERAPEPSFGVHTLDGGSLAAGRGFDGGDHELGDVGGRSVGGVHPLGGGDLAAGRGFGGGEHELGDRGHELSTDLAVGGRVGDSHIMYGRVARFGRGGVFLGYNYPDPGVCYQYPEYYNPAVGCYGLYPIG